MLDPGLGFGGFQQFDEQAALDGEQPFLVDPAAGLDLAAAQGDGGGFGDLVVVRRDHAALLHVDQHHLEGGDAGLAGDRDVARHRRRRVAGIGHGPRFLDRHPEQLMGIEQDAVARFGKTEFDRFDGALGDLGHGDALEHRLQVVEDLARRRRLRRPVGGANGEFLAAAAGRDHPDTGLDQPDVALQRHDPLAGVHDELATAAQRHALHRGNDRHLGVFQGLRGALKLLDGLFQQIKTTRRTGFGNLRQVGADGERRLVPDDDAIERRFGLADGGDHAVEHFVADGVHLGLEGQDADAAVDRRQAPQADAVVFKERLAGLGRAGGAFAEHAFREQLVLVDRQRRTVDITLVTRRPRTERRMHAFAAGFQRPGRQRRAAHGLAGGDVVGDGPGDVGPAGRLPGLERPLRPAEAPAHGEIDVAGVVGDVLQLHRAVVKNVAEDGPQELRLRVIRGAQRGEFLGRRLDFQQGGDFLGDFAGRGAVILQPEVEHLNFLALLAEDAAARFLSQRTLLDQCLEPGRDVEMAVPRIARQRVAHGADGVGQRIEADDIAGAVGGALRAADLRAGQRIDFVEAEAEGGRVVHDSQDRKDADPVGDEVRGVQRADHILAEARGQPGFQRVERAGVGAFGADDFDQRHVARRVEEMNAAEARPHRLGQALGQHVHRQAGGVGGDDGLRPEMRRDLGVEVVLPVHALGNGLDDQVALGQQRQVLLVIGGIDVFELALAGQRRRVQLLQAVEGLEHDTVLVAFLGRQVKQHHRHVGIGQVRRDLRPHHPGAEHRGFLHDQLVQTCLLWSLFAVSSI